MDAIFRVKADPITMISETGSLKKHQFRVCKIGKPVLIFGSRNGVTRYGLIIVLLCSFFSLFVASSLVCWLSHLFLPACLLRGSKRFIAWPNHLAEFDMRSSVS